MKVCNRCPFPAAVEVYAYQPGMWYLNPNEPVVTESLCSVHFEEWEGAQPIPDLKAPSNIR